jgi:hypothetical protein
LDLEKQSGQQVVEWSFPDISWHGDGGDRGLRGIAFDDKHVYVTTCNDLLVYSPDFKQLARIGNPYLNEAHGISIWQRTLYVTSAGFDSVLGFDLDQQAFTWAMQVKSLRHKYLPSRYDPTSDDGPLLLKKLHLNNVYCNEHGMYLLGLHTNGLLHFNGEQINMAVQLPAGCRDARPFRDGVLFNDSGASALRYTGRGEGEEDRGMPLPESATPGFARGLCVLNDHMVAGGSTPATIAIYDLAANQTLGSVQLTTDPNCCIHSIALWPFD